MNDDLPIIMRYDRFTRVVVHVRTLAVVNGEQAPYPTIALPRLIIA